MSIEIYRTDEKCPNCGVNILRELTNHVYSEGGKDFEYECPSCGCGLEIMIVPVPAFTISKVKSALTQRGADLSERGGSAHDRQAVYNESLKKQ
jgi:predicted RNA-binding Zn-ribbon protein involved in translation (DUF1610 family)